ncbi:MAG: hypothetical protein CVV53_04455 [Spirochaetae bacterium HGW-Spirochaetae-9]|nr:MAG: hypothetical protein CVV53_04455 [Spirochaetae bacterium HGW-Spirochaetae-9]
MAKIGSRIQETRLRKGLTLDRIADDTNISLRFLSKIENDDFTGFPGEPYIVGFIRNYSEYLGLDPEIMIGLYRAQDDEIPPVMVEASAAQEAASKPETPAKPEISESAVEGDAAPAGEPEIEKPKKVRKPKAIPAEPISEPSAETTGPKPRNRSPARAKKAPAPSLEVRLAPPSPPPETVKKKVSFSTIMLSILAIAIVVVAALWIVAGGVARISKQEDGEKAPSEYRVEGGAFEMRLYIGDSLLVPLGNDVYKIRLAAIGDTVDLETPFGIFKLALSETAPIDPGKDGSADASIVIGDFEKNRPASGALVKVEFSALEPSDYAGSDITIPENASAVMAENATNLSAPKTDTVIIKSTRGPYPFVVQVSFRGSCLFRYEADRKEWVEKYFSKGESITLNVTNALTVWTSNAQAVKMSFQASGGKTADLELGQPGEIAVKRISWSQSGGSWALISSNLD